jgi:glycerol-3-phosphate dehydrogenase
LGEDVRAHLTASFGARAQDVVGLLAMDNGRLAQRLVRDLPHLAAEVRYAVTHEHALEVEDVLCRRVPLFRLDRDQGRGCAAAVADEIGHCLGWNASRRLASLRRYEAAVDGSRQWLRQRPLRS